jgi:hypothetical protein
MPRVKGGQKRKKEEKTAPQRSAKIQRKETVVVGERQNKLPAVIGEKHCAVASVKKWSPKLPHSIYLPDLVWILFLKFDLVILIYFICL